MARSGFSKRRKNFVQQLAKKRKFRARNRKKFVKTARTKNFRRSISRQDQINAARRKESNLPMESDWDVYVRDIFDFF